MTAAQAANVVAEMTTPTFPFTLPALHARIPRYKLATENGITRMPSGFAMVDADAAASAPRIIDQLPRESASAFVDRSTEVRVSEGVCHPSIPGVHVAVALICPDRMPKDSSSRLTGPSTRPFST